MSDYVSIILEKDIIALSVPLSHKSVQVTPTFLEKDIIVLLSHKSVQVTPPIFLEKDNFVLLSHKSVQVTPPTF